jgi:NAD(P)-dependent dehydrogenase (short-subunit alcohol dehydrogenase family)
VNVYISSFSKAMASLNDFVVVVTGGGSGIGLATSIELCQRGATVWIAEKSSTAPETLKQLIQDGRIHFRGDVDVIRRESCTKFMDEVMEKHGRLDGLVNNAGLGISEGLITTDEAYDTMMDINVRGVWNYGTHALRIMQKQEPRGKWGSKGNIVNVSSLTGLRGFTGFAVYGATKHAVAGLTRG